MEVAQGLEEFMQGAGTKCEVSSLLATGCGIRHRMVCREEVTLLRDMVFGDDGHHSR
jgi:hypothetical protein